MADEPRPTLLDRAAELLTGADDPALGATTLELRKALLREVEFALLPYQSLRPVPVHRIDVLIRAPEPDVRQRYEYALHHEIPPFEQAALLQLAHAGLALPAATRVEAHVLDAWPDGAGVPPERRVFVRLHRRDERDPVAAAGAATAALRVLRGEAEQREYALAPGAPVTIGRGREHLVRGEDGRLVHRVNTVVFVEPPAAPEAAPVPEAAARENAGVSRAHATVSFDPNAGRYRVCWDGNAPVVHVRGGERLEVRSRLQYVYLEDGDVLELGVGAALEFRTPGATAL